MEENNNNNDNKVAEEAKKLIKSTAQKLGKKFIVWAAPAIGSFLVVVLAVGLINLTVYRVKANMGFATSVSANEMSVDKVETIVVTGENGEYQFKDDYSSQVIDDLESQNIDTEAMKFITEDGDNMLDKYLKVETQTMLPQTGLSGDFDGIIKIQKASAETGTTTALNYKEYNQFCSMVTAQNEEVLKCFSLNPDTFELCIAAKETTVYKDFEGQEITSMKTSSITKREIEYLTSIQNYAAPYNFFLALHMVAQDTDFMNEVIEMVLGSDDPIVLTYIESSTVETTQKDYSGEETVTTITTTKVDGPDTADNPDTEENEYDPNITITISDPVERKTLISNDNIQNYNKVNVDYHQKIKTTNIGTLHVTKADTWIKKTEKEIGELVTDEIAQGEPSSTVLVDETSTTNNPGHTVISGDDSSQTTTTSQKISTHVYIEEQTSINAENKMYTLVDKEGQIKVDDFVELIKKYPKVKNNIETSPSQILYILQQDENTQKFEQIMRYVVYKLAGLDYGVTDEDLPYLLSDTFIDYSGTSSLKNYLEQYFYLTENDEDSIQQAYDNVVYYTEDLNLSKQQLYALTVICGDFSSLPTIEGKTFADVYEEGLNTYDEGSWQHNQYIWNNWWSKLGESSSLETTAIDAAFETYVKGVFDFSLSDAGEVDNRTKYVYFTTQQLADLGADVTSLPTSITTGNQEELFTTEQSAGTFEVDNTDSRIKGYYTSTTNRVFTVLNQNTITNWGDKCNRAAAAIIASGYSNQTADELINIINTNKATYGWDSVPTDKYFNLYGLQVDLHESDYKYVDEYTPLIREQLKNGGYAMVWLKKNDVAGEYYGKSGQKWTSKFHWLAILDYKIEGGVEKMLITDWHGAAWYSMDEFQYGISELVLISEM